ncbi:hypothetical protein [Domibacillus robiginosus]|nr:hypothetical protein [Domibacillus robiginosus]
MWITKALQHDAAFLAFVPYEPISGRLALFLCTGGLLKKGGVLFS